MEQTIFVLYSWLFGINCEYKFKDSLRETVFTGFFGHGSAANWGAGGGISLPEAPGCFSRTQDIVLAKLSMFHAWELNPPVEFSRQI